QQVQTAIEQKADIIILLSGSPDALNGVIKQAYDAGIVVIASSCYVTSPYAIVVNTNNVQEGISSAKVIVELLKGKGHVLAVDGAAGVASNTQIHAGYELIYGQNPGITVDYVNGDWTESKAKTECLKYFSTHPGKVDAIEQQGGGMFMGCVSALEEAGRPLVPVVMGDVLECELAFANNHKDDPGWGIAGHGNPAGSQADAAFRMGIATAMGCGPKLSCVLGPSPSIDKDNFDEWYKEGMSEDSNVFIDPPDGWYLGQDQLDLLFTTKPEFPAKTAMMP
ncbi:MAG: substrate-binding domain-containing protein, partial [Clostridiaceae bacterium]|nr:substrate-binding domain-containing protein [Clostridiaceae bacterium]